MEKNQNNYPTKGGGPQGGYLGNLEYLAQSITSADCVANDSKFNLSMI